MKVTLPEGHKWREQDGPSASETYFVCRKCGAEFLHDMIDNSHSFEDGNGDCDVTTNVG